MHCRNSAAIPCERCDFRWLIEEVYDSHDDNLDFTATYSFDLVGNRLEKTVDQGSDSSIDETITCTYDDNDRLLTEVKDLASGTDTTTTYEYGGPTNPGTEQTKKTVTNTATSALIQTVESTYNLQGRLSEVVIDTYDSGDVVKRETTTYEYDESGTRVGSTNKVEVDDDADPQTPLVVESETETTYLNDPQNPTGYSQTIEEITRDTATQAVTRDLVFTLGHDVIAQTEIDPAQAGTDPGDPLFLLYDGHGSTRFLAALDAAIQQGYSYDAYGNPIGFDPAAALTALLYSGEAFDTRINQQYLRARWYDLSTGRFNRLDPFAGNLNDPQSLHKYLYTHADPVNRVDPTGKYAMAVLRMIFGMGFWAVARILLGLAAELTIRLAYLEEVNNSRKVQWKNEQIGRIGDDDLPQGGFRDEFKLKPDILDKDLTTFYEIKSDWPASVQLGRRKLKGYQDALALRFPADDYTKGLWNPRRTRYPLVIPGWVGGFPLPMHIRVYRTEPGLILYSEWDVQRLALIAGLVGAIAPDIIRHVWQVWRGPGQAPAPNFLRFPGQGPPLQMPVPPIAAGIGAIGIGGGFAGIGGMVGL